MVLDRTKLKKLLKEKGVNSLDDFNAFMRDVSKDVYTVFLTVLHQNPYAFGNSTIILERCVKWIQTTFPRSVSFHKEHESRKPSLKKYHEWSEFS